MPQSSILLLHYGDDTLTTYLQQFIVLGCKSAEQSSDDCRTEFGRLPNRVRTTAEQSSDIFTMPFILKMIVQKLWSISMSKKIIIVWLILFFLSLQLLQPRRRHPILRRYLNRSMRCRIFIRFSAVIRLFRGAGREKDIMQAKMFRRDSGDKFTIVILKPDVRKGQDISSLTITSGSTILKHESSCTHPSRKTFRTRTQRTATFGDLHMRKITKWNYIPKIPRSFEVYIVDLKADNTRQHIRF